MEKSGSVIKDSLANGDEVVSAISDLSTYTFIKARLAEMKFLEDPDIRFWFNTSPLSTPIHCSGQSLFSDPLLF